LILDPSGFFFRLFPFYQNRDNANKTGWDESERWRKIELYSGRMVEVYPANEELQAVVWVTVMLTGSQRSSSVAGARGSSLLLGQAEV
jgi:hypothetical protein